MKVYLLILLIAIAITALVTPVVREVTIATHILTPVRARDVHTKPIPRLGGVAMLIGFIGAMLFGARMPYLSKVFESTQAWPLLLGAIGICFLGVLDDIWDLDWYTKLAGQLLIVGAVSWQGIQMLSFPIFGVTIGSARLSAVATVVIVVATINAVNFVDGLDGLAAGMLMIGATAFFIYSYFLSRSVAVSTYASFTSLTCIALAGICMGFLLHNFFPATIFMGDSGAMLLGYLFGCAAIIISGQVDPTRLANNSLLSTLVPLILPFAVIFVPLLDMTMAVVRRLRQGKSPFHPDKMHLHHRMLRLGHSHRRAVLLFYIWTALISFSFAALIRFSITQTMVLAVPGALLAVFITFALAPELRLRFKRFLQEQGRRKNVTK